MYESGLGLKPIAAFFRVSRQAMWDLLRRRITLRPQRTVGERNHFYRGGTRADDRAQNLAEQAIQDGILSPASKCEACGASPVFKDGRSGIQGHHDDYSKPLAVRWLCQPCHHEWHKTHKAAR